MTRSRPETSADAWHDLDYLPVWAGEAVDLAIESDPAGAIVARIAEEALHAKTPTQEHPPSDSCWDES